MVKVKKLSIRTFNLRELSIDLKKQQSSRNLEKLKKIKNKIFHAVSKKREMGRKIFVTLLRRCNFLNILTWTNKVIDTTA